MLEGNPVENTPADLIRQVEAWVETYPEERGNVADALANAVDRLREPGPNLQPFTWLGFAHFKPRRRVNLQVGGTAGLSIYPVLRRTVKNPPTPATSGGAPERWHLRKLETAWRTRRGSWAVVPASSEPPGWFKPLGHGLDRFQNYARTLAQTTG